MKSFYILVLVILLFHACKSNEQEVQNIYNEYRFDSIVIQKLPMYDSLVAALFRNQSILKQYARQDGENQPFRFMPLSDDGNVYKKFPPELSSDVGAAYNQLGEKYIAGFDVFSDSSIKIYVRRNKTRLTSVSIDENLSFFPPGKAMRERVFPMRDSVLNPRWQYWIRVNEQGLF